MAVPTQYPGPSHNRGTWFATTDWSLILAAADSQDPNAQEALDSLCQIYWHPVYAYIRRRGYQDMAQDLTQGFFTQLLEKQYIKSARSERGRFRSFLLASVKNYLANEWDREQAQKRGGGTVLLSMDFEGAKASLPEPGHEITPEVVFERQWALTVLENVLAALRQEMVRSGNEERFQRLKGFLTGEQAGIKLRTVATELEMSEGAVKVAIHRMRRRFGEMLQSEIASTLNDPREVDEEIRYLFAVITS